MEFFESTFQCNNVVFRRTWYNKGKQKQLAVVVFFPWDFLTYSSTTEKFWFLHCLLAYKSLCFAHCGATPFRYLPRLIVRAWGPCPQTVFLFFFLQFFNFFFFYIYRASILRTLPRIPGSKTWGVSYSFLLIDWHQ